ncbi:MAG TPA: hypothetical protein VHV08_01680, partial [Pirellulales bacterium]|nr:hypothetical protein [Pirellulales bacterium]
PSEETLRRYARAPIPDDRQRDFILLCRGLGIRTIAGFMVGFPDDTEDSIMAVLRYAKSLNPTFANFNIVTPYPGTEFFEEIKSQIATFDPRHYTVYTPVLKYRNLTSQRVAELHAKCFTSYYFRSRWLEANAPVLWPGLRKLGFGRAAAQRLDTRAHRGPPSPHGPLRVVERPRPAAQTTHAQS